MEAGIEVLRWVAAIATIAAAGMVSWGEPARLVAWGFALFCLSATAWVAAGLLQGQWALTAQNVVLLGVNVWGLRRWWAKSRREGAGTAARASG
ncbi:MAG: hypothetical protein ACU0CO_05800 [Shimia sp.]